MVPHGVSVVARACGEGDLGSRTARGDGLIGSLAPEPAVQDSVVHRLAGLRQRTRDDGQVDVGGSDHHDVRTPTVRLSDTENPVRDEFEHAVGIDVDAEVHERDAVVGRSLAGSRPCRPVGTAVGDRHSAGMHASRLDSHRQRSGAHQPVIDRERDRQRIVQRHPGPARCARASEVTQGTGKGCSVAAQRIAHQRPAQAHPPGHVERNEGDPHPGREYPIRGDRVDVEIELRGRGHVARLLDRATHDDQPPDPPHRVRVRIECPREVGERPERGDGERLAVLARLGHDRVRGGPTDWLRPVARGKERSAVTVEQVGETGQPVFAVHVRRSNQPAAKGTRRAAHQAGRFVGIEEREQAACVVGRCAHAGVAGDGGHELHAQLRGAQRQHDCERVVDARVGVDDQRARIEVFDHSIDPRSMAVLCRGMTADERLCPVDPLDVPCHTCASRRIANPGWSAAQSAVAERGGGFGTLPAAIMRR